MNSKERHEARYQRRKKAREEKRRKKCEACGDFETVFSYENLYKAGQKCVRGVSWKASTQNYRRKMISNTYSIYDKLKNNKFKFSKPYVFWICEREKTRKIQAQKINERVMQRCLCDNLITPIYDEALVYDSGANRKNKGMDHAMNRVNCHMQRHFRKYGLNGYIVTCDFRDFFNSAPHDAVYMENERRIFDKKLKNAANMCMEVYGKTGFGLGAHTSQIYTSIALNPLDHYIKDTLRIKSYGRYVDDFYFFAENLEEAKTNLKKIRQKVKELGLELNEKKTRIRRFKDGFYFLKTMFFCTETGKIVRKINRKSAVRMRRKLRTFKKWIDEGILTKEQAINSYYSWRGHMIRGNSYIIIIRMDEYMRNILEQ